MKRQSLIICFLLGTMCLNAQENINEDSLRFIIHQQKADTSEVNAFVSLSNLEAQPDSTIKYAQQGLMLAQKINYKKGEADCLFLIGTSSTDFTQTIENILNALNIYSDLHDHKGVASSHLILQGTYREARDYSDALIHAFTGEQIAEANNETGELSFTGHRLAPLFLAEISQTYILMNKLDSALIYANKSITQNELFNGAKWNFPIYLLATIQNLTGNYILALSTYRSAIPLAKQNKIFQDTLQILSGISNVFKNMGELDSAIYYAQIVEQSPNPEKEISYLMDAVENLGQVYKLKGNADSALKYTQLGYKLRDSIYSEEKDHELQNITFNERLKQQQIISDQQKYKSRIQLYAMVAGLFSLLLIAGILWRSNRHRQRDYLLLEKQKNETDIQKLKVEQAFDELKQTQVQLIQSEKMASLGELTAGIAHEIQNPLNFVNNFSEVNRELITEMKNEIDSGNFSEVKVIAKNIEDNEEKIIVHGKRAEAIVKSMLQHSRASTGKKEPTDINKLADDYLRLCYHGLRAKDKSLNAKLETDFDSSIGKINIVPQDIGRVLLNLYNNAFYAVNEKAKQQPNGHGPTIKVSSKKINNKVELTVKDNGNGIPQNIVDKIFQPFFTTKPTGQGTGLGLSLSYDIIKAHGGEIKVETKEGEGSTFIIQLPGL